MAVLRIDRLQRGTVIVNEDGTAGDYLIRLLNGAFANIESVVNAQGGILDAITAAQDAADTAHAAADAANTAASNAQTAADTVTADASLTNSYVTGLTLQGTDAGSDATVTISGHTRVYGDGTSVSVTGGNVAGLAYSTPYYIYYDQASRAGGAVTYQATTSQSTAAQTGDRHLVGLVTTPAALGGAVNGDGVLPPGVGNIIP